jgi:putative restriction endonuclease
MSPLDRTRLEKALFDHGFDLTPTFEAGGLVGRSTQHPIPVRLELAAEGAITLASSNEMLRAALQREGFACLDEAAAEPKLWHISSPDFSVFYRTLGRFAALARSLPNQVAERFVFVTRNLPASTETERLVVQRIGQDMFRSALIDYWQGRCAVTGLDVIPLLRASHIKPWAACSNDAERLDVFNGLLLAPHLDALFDGGWITFLDDGAMLASEGLTPIRLQQLGIQPELRLTWISDSHRAYLAYHRSLVFSRQVVTPAVLFGFGAGAGVAGLATSAGPL